MAAAFISWAREMGMLASVDWFYVAALYVLIFFLALIVTLALIWGYLARHL